MKIILFRHGPPEFDFTRRVKPSGLQQALADYAESVVVEKPSLEILALAEASPRHIATCSECVRAQSSATLLGFGDVTTSPLLNESMLPHPNELPFRLPWHIVLLLFRVAWLFGYKKNASGIRMDRGQARKAGDWLIELAQTHDEVFVVGHGIMNRMIVMHLKGNGWNKEIMSGGGYWSHCVLSKECEEHAP